MVKNTRKIASLALAIILTAYSSSSILEPIFHKVPIAPDSLTSFAEVGDFKVASESGVKSIPKLKQGLKETCEVFTNGPIAVGNGARILTKSLNLDGCIGDFRFDQQIEIDQSGNSNVVLGHVKTRPGPQGVGRAALFENMNSDVYELEAILDYEHLRTVSFNVMLMDNGSKDQECPVFLRGRDEIKSGKQFRSPGIYINQKTGQVSAYAPIKGKVGKQSVSAKTIGKLRTGKWTQVTVLFEDTQIQIYLNGILDGFGKAAGGQHIDLADKEFTKSPIFVGGHFDYESLCDLKLSISYLKMYNRVLKIYEIQASAGTPFGIIQPSYIHLSCYDCSYSTAVKQCVSGYSLCNQEELYGGVWEAIFRMGWSDLSYHVFVGGEKSSKKGLGICCRNDM